MATRRKAAKKKAAKKRSAARGARRRPAAKKRVAKKRPAKKRAVRKAAKRRVAKKRTVRKVAKKRPVRKVAKRAAKKRTARPARKAPKKRAAKAAKPARKAAPKARAPRPTAFAPQKAEATAKDLLLFELERARVAVLAAIQGLGAGSAMQPVAEGKWSIHELVLHLSVRDRVRLEEFDSLLSGNPASWTGASPEEQAATNEAHLAPLRDLSWDDAVRLLMTTRAELVGRLQAVPAEPAEVWTTLHPFGASMLRLPDHDRGHAEAIKNARIAG